MHICLKCSTLFSMLRCTLVTNFYRQQKSQITKMVYLTLGIMFRNRVNINNLIDNLLNIQNSQLELLIIILVILSTIKMR